jgi:asparagine synthase (glutamine-hydrolysing)
MCGIFGILGSVDKELLSAMSKALNHRGPDDNGFFLGKNVALGNTRLSITDVKGGHQPIHNEDSTMWITFNGEIYNFRELRSELEKSGHKFYTHSDTEVIVHAYEEWKENCVENFNGMWAFAIWDSVKKRLVLSRDRLGIKPLYYFSDGRHFVFASEIKALLLDKSVPKTPNDKMIYEYLLYGFHDHTEQTFFSEVRRLLPAHNLVIDENGIVAKKYWDIPFNNKKIESSNINDNTYAEQFLGLFKDSVRTQLISEVPLGTCLSGGLDSSSIACMIDQLLGGNTTTCEHAAMLTEDRQETFTAGFDDEKADEREYAEEVNQQIGAEKHLVFPTSRQLWDDVSKLVYFQEEPFLGTSVYAHWSVMKLAGQKVKVVLDGQGGDELLAGYLVYHLVFIQNLLKKKKIISFVKESLLSLDIIAPSLRYYLFWSYPKRLKEIKALLNRVFVSEFASTKQETALTKYEDLPELMYRDVTTTNLPALLRYEDKNSMAFSIESRVPFLDHRLVEYVFSLPVTQKLKNGWTKRVLRNAMKGVIPEKVRKRRKKSAFATPQETWLKELGKEIREVFASSRFRDRKYFNQQEVLKKFDEFCGGRSRRHHDIIWRMLNLELWLRTFIDGKDNSTITARHLA